MTSDESLLADNQLSDAPEMEKDVEWVPCIRGHSLYSTTTFEYIPSTSSSFFGLGRALSLHHLRTSIEWCILFTCGVQVALYASSSYSKSFFLISFLCWRTLFILGIGSLLHLQSTKASLMEWAIHAGLGSNIKTPRSSWAIWLIDQIKSKVERDTEYEYDYNSMLVEFNAWLLFKEIVNFVVVNEMLAFSLFSISFANWPQNGTTADILGYVGGAILIALSVKFRSEAHQNASGEYSSYWGEFFFLIDDAQRFDGMFEMVLHPSYLVGYIGYYGVALITHSYTVLFVGLGIHLSRLLLYFYVEKPHSEKIFLDKPNQERFGSEYDQARQTFFSRDLIIFQNLDLFRSSDLFTLLIVLYTVLLAWLMGPIQGGESWKTWFFAGQCLVWRLVHTYGNGLVLFLQAKYKFWNKHYYKHGDDVQQAFHHWKVWFNLSLTMTYTTFAICALKFYELPDSYSEGPVILRHILGLLFILLHIWITVSIYEVLGPLGWFYGDFFIDSLRLRGGPTYLGIYKYLDNPVLYTFSCWGATLICNSWPLFWITLVGQISNILFVNYVEHPLLVLLYGDKVRQRDGVRKTLKRSVRTLGDKVKQGLKALTGKSSFSRLRRTFSFAKLADDESDLDIREERLDAQNGALQSEADVHVAQIPFPQHSRRTSTFSTKLNTGTHSPTLESCHTPPPSRRQDHEDDSIGIVSSGETDLDDEHHDSSTQPLLHQRTGSFAKKLSSSLFSLSDSRSDMTDDDEEDNGSRPAALNERAVTRTIKLVVKELEELVETAKPHVHAMVRKTRLSVANLANAARLEDTLSRDELPLDLYSLSFPTKSVDDQVPVFQFGEPIVIEFTACRETMKRKDWIGLYFTHQNFDPQMTTSKCNDRWSYVAGHCKPIRSLTSPSSSPKRSSGLSSPTPGFSDDLYTSPWSMSMDNQHFFGRTPVTVETVSSDPGHRIVRGRLVYSREQLPWQVGTFEARYHYDGQYVVLATSRVFRVSLDIRVAYPVPVAHSLSKPDLPDLVQDNTDIGSVLRSESPMSVPDDAQLLVQELHSIIERCLDIHIDNGDERLDIHEKMLDRVTLPPVLIDSVSLDRYKKLVSKRIVYVIQHLYGIELSIKVVDRVGSLVRLAQHVYDAQGVLFST